MYLRFTAGGNSAGKTVYTIMRREMNISASLLRRLKQAGGFTVNGSTARSTCVLNEGDELLVDITSSEPPCGIVPQCGDIDIIFENDGFLALNKPCGMLVHPSRAKYTGTLANFAAGYLEEKSGSGCVHAVNRLDRDTGGVVLFAKNGYMKERGCAALASDTSDKEYIAVVCGRMENCSGVINSPIKRADAHDMMRVVAPDGQSAVTYYEAVGEAKVSGLPVSVLRLRLGTGRTHQIRVHMKSIGHPVLGDVLYFSGESRALSEEAGITAQMLHAFSLTFDEPRTGEHLILKAPIKRRDMAEIVGTAGFSY